MSFLVNPYILSDASGCASIQTTSTTYGSGTSNDVSIPVYGLYDYDVNGIILLQSDLGTAKQFTALEVDFGGYTTPYTFNTQDVYFYHTTASEFNATQEVDLSDLTTSDETKVIDGQTLTISTTGFKKLTFDTNFCYNGSDNVIIKWENRDGSWQSGYGHAETNSSATNRGFEKHQDTTFPTGTTSRTSAVYNVKLHY